MGLYFPCAHAFLAVILVAAGHATLSPEHYWKSTLPNTPMPKAVSDLLQPDEKTTTVSIGKGGVNVTVYHKPTGTEGSTGIEASNGTSGNSGNENGNSGSSGSGNGDNGSSSNGNSGGNGNSGESKAGDNGNGNGSSGGNNGNGNGSSGNGNGNGNGKGDKKKPKPPPVRVNVFVYKTYRYNVGKNQLLNDPNVALFFLEKDVHKGARMKLHFVKTSNGAAFLPRHVTEPIPMSSAKLPEILAKFSVAPGSAEADMIKETIEDCESPAVKGEEKSCPSSLEAMVDFIASKLGRNVEALSTEVEKDTGMQTYTVAQMTKKTDGENSVVCHKQSYVYAVFYCHASHTMKTFTVSLEASDGSKGKAIAVCHTDTSAWNPKHVAFQFLKVNPGTPVCHFLPEEHIVWIPVKTPA